MRRLYDLESGKLHCRCLIRKWKFCSHIKTLAGGRVTPQLVKCTENDKGGKWRGRVANERDNEEEEGGEGEKLYWEAVMRHLI